MGEHEFLRRATEIAQEQVREGLPLRAEIDVVGYTARAPQEAGDTWPHDNHSGGFLTAPGHTADVRRLYDEDAEGLGYVMNASRLWGHLPSEHEALFELIGAATQVAHLSVRDRGILVTAMASTLGDSYCALAWGGKLAGAADAGIAVGVLAGTDEGLSPTEVALARWARRVTADPNATVPEDVDELRQAGYDDAQILAITFYIGLRIAFSTVNDALGASPDRELRARLPRVVRDAVTWGRPAEA